MEAQAGAIEIGTRQRVEAGRSSRPPRRRLRAILTGMRRRRVDRAVRKHALHANGDLRFLPGSEHTHLLRRPRF